MINYLIFHVHYFILAILDNAESRYRNILSFKVDEKEIMLAVDNGNIEIYDRYSMKMTCLLVGQYSASPVKIDFNSNLIFVQYTCAFWRRRQSPSSWWNIYCRYSCNNITTTLIQISRLFYFGFFSKTNHQMII